MPPPRQTRNREPAVFSEADRATFLRLLETFVETFNADTRAPIRSAAPAKRNGHATVPDRTASD